MARGTDPPIVTTNLTETQESKNVTIRVSETTFETTSASTKTDGRGISPAVTLAILLAASFILVLGALACFYYRKRRCIQGFHPLKRSSSTSSQGPLAQEVATVVSPPGLQQEWELFSVSGQDGGADGRQNTEEDDYFYDEIFERSAFVDESISRANKHISMDDDDGTGFDDKNITDLVLKEQY